MSESAIVSKVWNFAHVLRDDGVSYGDYLEQITYLLFLKMIDELNKPPYNKEIQLPKLKDAEGKELPGGELCNWDNLSNKRGAELEAFYNQLLRSLSTEKGILGQIFTKSQNKIQNPALLSRLINMIAQEQWTVVGEDVKGAIYEGLLEKNAADTKSGAGQYFTPRPLISTIIKCVNPEPNKKIHDPACGTGGFFLMAEKYISENHELDLKAKRYLKHGTFSGNEIVANTRRLCLMNMYLHNIGDITGEPSISPNDSLVADDGIRVDYVLTNPPFGKKSSYTITNEQGEQNKVDISYNRQDFWVTTSNKQLNFLQHIRTLLKQDGKAAVVLPDNVLFEGGAGETIRTNLMKTTNLHTILRLPTGLFYAHGVKANVLFFDNKPAAREPWTKVIWFYDYRTNVHHTLKKNPLTDNDLEDFIKCYNTSNIEKRKETWSENNPDGRWRKYTYEEIMARDKSNLDIFWLKDKSLTDLDNLPDPDIIADEIMENLTNAVQRLKEITDTLNVDEE